MIGSAIEPITFRVRDNATERTTDAFVLGLSPATALANPTPAPTGGNSINAKLCQKNGWKTLARTTSDTVAFTSETECVANDYLAGTVNLGGPCPP